MSGRWHRATFAAVAVAFVAAPAFAVSPLTVDDADTVERGRLQLNGGWQFTRFADDVSLHSLPVNPVLGLTARGELGLTFGHQWRTGPKDDPATADTDGITDLTLSTKGCCWRSADETLRLSLRLDGKLPTASTSRGLGTGKADFGGVVIATRTWNRTHLDGNCGYTFTGVGSGGDGDDQWFLGLAVRHELNGRWTLLGETYALIPPGGSDTSATFHFNGGAQFHLRKNFLVSVLIGSAAGRNSPGLTGYVGLTWDF